MRAPSFRVVPMRLAPLLLAVVAFVLPGTARAGGDAAAAGSFAVLGLQAPRQSLPVFGFSLSNTGFGFARTDEKGFFYLASDWNQLATFDLGFGGVAYSNGPFTLWGGGGLLGAPVDGVALGLHGLAGVVWHYGGDGFFFRPGLTLSPGFTASSAHGLRVIMPFDASLEFGLELGQVKPFVRVAAGVDPVASPYFYTARAQALLGVSVSFEPSPPLP